MSVRALNQTAIDATEENPPGCFVSNRSQIIWASLPTKCRSLLAALLLALFPGAAVPQDSIVLDDDFLLITRDNGHPPKGDSPRGDLVPSSDPHAQSATEPYYRNLCENYTYGTGWKRPMELYLGEGAREHLPEIRQAVKVWNDLVPGLIDLKEDLVNYPYLGAPYVGLDKYRDETSVIYFPSVWMDRRGFAIARQGPSDGIWHIVESDVFVRAARERHQPSNLNCGA